MTVALGGYDTDRHSAEFCLVSFKTQLGNCESVGQTPPSLITVDLIDVPESQLRIDVDQILTADVGDGGRILRVYFKTPMVIRFVA